MTQAPLDNSERNPVEVLAEEFVERYRRGERPTLDEYADRYPQWAEQIRGLFPALVVMEKVRPEPELHAPRDSSLFRVGEPRIERLGDYRILREIGRGGMGIVYEAEQESLGRHVALKVLLPNALLDSRHLQRFERESRAAARLHHTNIVPVFGVGEHGGLHYYVMQFIPGQGLDEVLVELRRLRERVSDKREAGSHKQVSADRVGNDRTHAAGEPARDLAQNMSGAVASRHTSATHAAQALLTGEFHAEPWQREASGKPQSANQRTQSHSLSDTRSPASRTMPTLPGQTADSDFSEFGRPYWESIARVGVQAADGLAYAHAQGIFHRDIKPSNLLLDPHGTVWITDFGLAKATDSDDLTYTGDIVGTLRYMAPERFSGQSDARGDIYSLGLTLYEMLTLRPAFDESDRHKLVERVLHHDPPSPRRLAPNIPRDLETIILKSTARMPEQRYQTAADLSDDLGRVLEDRPIRARPVGQLVRAWRWCRRKPALAIVSTLLALAMLIGVPAVFIQWRRAEKSADFANGQRELAEQRHQKSHQAVHHYFTLVSENKLLGKPGMQPLRKDLLESALPYYEQFLREHQNDPTMRAELAATHARIALINDQIDSKNAARFAFLRSLGFYEQLVRDRPDEAEFQATLARTYRQLGSLELRVNNLDEALSALDKARDIQGQLATAEPDSPQYKCDLLMTYRSIGNVHLKKDQREQAIRDHEIARTLGQQLVDAYPDRVEYQIELSMSLTWLGEIAYTAGHLTEALGFLEPARKIQQQLVMNPTCGPEVHSDLADILGTIGNVHNQNGELDDAVKAWELARDIRERLVHENPSVTEFQWRLATAYSYLGKQYSQKSEMPAALACWQQAVPLAEKLVRLDPSVPEYRTRLVDLHLDRGHVQSKIGEQANALQSFAEARAIAEQLVSDSPQTGRFRFALGICCHNHGNELQQIGRTDEAMQAFEKCRKLFEDLAAADPKAIQYQRLLIFTYNKIGGLHERALNYGLAQAAYQQALDISEPLYKANPGPPEFRKLLASCYTNMGNVARGQKDSSHADRYYQQALDIHTELALSFPKHTDVFLAAARAARDLADLQRELNEPRDALQIYQKARSYGEQGIQLNSQDTQVKGVLAEILDGIGLCLARLDRRDEALVARDQAIQLQQTLLASAPNNTRARDLLADHYRHQSDLCREMRQLTKAVSLIRERQKLFPENAARLFEVACDLASCLEIVDQEKTNSDGNHAPDRESLAREAMAVLEQSIRAGYSDLNAIRTSLPLKALEGRAEFQTLTRQSEK